LHGLLPDPFKSEQQSVTADDESHKFDRIAKIRYRPLIDFGGAVTCALKNSFIVVQIMYKTDDPPNDPLQFHIGNWEPAQERGTATIKQMGCISSNPEEHIGYAKGYLHLGFDQLYLFIPI